MISDSRTKIHTCCNRARSLCLRCWSRRCTTERTWQAIIQLSSAKHYQYLMWYLTDWLSMLIKRRFAGQCEERDLVARLGTLNTAVGILIASPVSLLTKQHIYEGGCSSGHFTYLRWRWNAAIRAWFCKFLIYSSSFHIRFSFIVVQTMIEDRHDSIVLISRPLISNN